MGEYVVTIVLIVLLPVMFLLGLLAGKPEYKPFVIRTIQATMKNGNTWEFKYPFNVKEDANYIFIVDMSKGQDN